MTSERHVSYQSIYKSKRKNRSFFLKQFSKFRASDNSDLQLKRSPQNKTTDYNNCTYIKTILFSENLLIRDKDQMLVSIRRRLQAKRKKFFVPLFSFMRGARSLCVALQLNLSDCRGQCYNNGANMKGKEAGL